MSATPIPISTYVRTTTASAIRGITRASTDIVRQAIAATRGQVLISEGRICDARFSKCCGGAFEEFQYCWEDIKYPYLAKQRDYLTGNEKTAPELPDLTQESEADRWIRTSPKHSAILRIRKSYHRFSTITTKKPPISTVGK